MIPVMFNWWVFVILSILGLAALVLALPLSTRVSRWAIAVASLLAMIGVGLLLAYADGIEASFIAVKSVTQSQTAHLLNEFGWALAVGISTGIVLLVTLYLISRKILPQLLARFEQERKIPVWKRYLIAIYSGILEEIIFRLFLLSFIAWVIGLFWHNDLGRPTLGALWLSNAIAAIAFGLVHLPRWSGLTKLTRLLTLVILGMNGLGGLAFGYLFMFHGIEAAIVAHFVSDSVLHTIGPKYLCS